MLGSNLKSLPDVELGEEERGYRRGPDGGAVMPKRAKSAAAPAAPRGAELRVFKASSAEGRLPAGSNLRKQKSLTNLAFLTDAEKKRQLYEPRWSDDMAKATATGAAAGGGGRGGGGPRGREAPAMSRSLSRSEHSLLSPRPAGPAKPPPAGKPSRIPRGPYAEVKPLSKAPEAGGGGGGGKCDDELLGGKGPAVAAGAEEKPYLKVDPELVVTVLGDLEQLLFSQMLDQLEKEGDECTQLRVEWCRRTSDVPGPGQLVVLGKGQAVVKLLQDLGANTSPGGVTANHVLHPGLEHGHKPTVSMEDPQQ
ncbi:hypothetical protein Q9233_008200 [Columba guinea]|nr:hypothetical protein Q9233_008200 [Columba guinea]